MYHRGSVIVATDPFGETPRRPYLILSDETHPFAGKQYIAAGISTVSYPESLSLKGEFTEGKLTRESFLAPWAIVSIRSEHIDRAVARVTDNITDRTAKRAIEFVGVDNSKYSFGGD